METAVDLGLHSSLNRLTEPSDGKRVVAVKLRTLDSICQETKGVPTICKV